MLAAKQCIPTERFCLMSNAHYFITNQILQKICLVSYLQQAKFISILHLDAKDNKRRLQSIAFKKTWNNILWNSPLNKKAQNQSRGKSGISLQRVNYVSWCKSRKSVRSDAFTGNRRKSKPTQYVYCCNWTCSLPCMLGIWGNFKGLIPCLWFTE